MTLRNGLPLTPRDHKPASPWVRLRQGEQVRYRDPVTHARCWLTPVQCEHMLELVDGLHLTELHPPMKARVLATLDRHGLAEVQLTPYDREEARLVVATLTPFGRRVLTEYMRRNR